MKSIKILIVSIFLSNTISLLGQEEIDRFDNWLLIGNRVVFGGDKNIIHSHELQWRVNDNMSSLKEWFYEGVFKYSPNAKWEITPDFRASIKPDKQDFRFGFGVVRKMNFKNENNAVKNQFVQQLKYQTDLDTKGNLRHGLRYILTYNHVVNEKFILSGLVGPFYRWKKGFSGIEFVRGGPVFTYMFDKMHTLAFAPLIGAAALGNDNGVTYSFTPMISLVIRVRDDYKYVPAKYINF